MVAGSLQTQNIPGKYTCGNKRLALIGDALLRLAIVDEWFDEDESRSDAAVPMAVTLAKSVTGECERKVQNVASNKNLQDQGYKIGLQGVVHSNPCQGGEVPRTAMASTMEAVIGAAWLDSGKDWYTACSIAKVLSQSR